MARHKLRASRFGRIGRANAAVAERELRIDPLNFRPDLWTQQFMSGIEKLRPMRAVQEV
jgi:hypothetical protein